MKKRKLMKGREKDLHFEFPFLGQNVSVPLFFPFCISEWKKLGKNISELPSVRTFKNDISKSIRPKSNSVFSVPDNEGVIFLNRLRVEFSHLREH